MDPKKENNPFVHPLIKPGAMGNIRAKLNELTKGSKKQVKRKVPDNTIYIR